MSFSKKLSRSSTVEESKKSSSNNFENQIPISDRQVSNRSLVGNDKDSFDRRENIMKTSTSGFSNRSTKSPSLNSQEMPKDGILKTSKLQTPTLTDSLLSAIKSVNDDLPSVDHDLRYTKMYLQKQGLCNLSVWSHLTDVLSKIIAEQPENIIDYFEEYSRKVKQEKLVIHDTLRDISVPPGQLDCAKNQLHLVNSYGVKDLEGEELEAGGEDEDKLETERKMDLEETAFYFKQAGIVIPEVLLFTLNIAMKKLAEEKTLVKPRFWGKIQGTKQDYFVLECELTEEEYGKRVEEDEAAEAERIAAEEAAAEVALEEKAQSEEKPETEQIKSSLKSDEETVEVGQGDIGEQVEQVVEKENFEVKESESKSSTKQAVAFEIPSDHALSEMEEQEDPLLPPLPPPKKLLKYNVPPTLKPVPKEIVKVPAEKLGEGVNKKIYYVTNTPELEWTELPKLTPEEINVARQIKVSFTGDLDSRIFTYPAFPGVERNYLRAQIARISASTQVSPLGFFRFGEGGGEEEEEEEVAEEEEEGGGDKTKLSENPKYQGIPIRDLIDPSLASWVHHSQNILKQGRTVWWGTKKATATEEEEEEQVEEEEEEEEGGGEEKEIGPPLLTSLSEDITPDGHPAWTVKRTYNYNAEMVAAVLKSNLWPGASAFAIGKKFDNTYFGWGHKNLTQGFSLTMLPHPEYEYDLGPEIMEIQDPTVEVEQTWREAHRRKPPPVEGEGEEGEEGEEEEEEDEDD